MGFNLGDLFVSIGADTSGLKKADKEVKSTSKSMEKSFSGLGKVIAGALTVEAARRSVMIADNMRRLDGVVKRLTKTTGDFNDVWNELNKISDENGVAIGDSIALFQRFQGALKSVTDQNDDVISFIDTLQKIGRIGGSSSQEMSNALTQLSQGFSGGIIRAEEWNSIIEQSPEILKVVAKNTRGVNGDLGILRKRMLDGKLTAESFYKAISDGATDVDKEFKDLPKTIDQSLAALSNSFSRFLKNLDKSVGGGTSAIAEFIGNLAIAADQASAEIDILFGKRTENTLAIQLSDLNDEIKSSERLLKKAQAANEGAWDPLGLGARGIKSQEENLKKLRAEYDKLQKQLQELRVGPVDDEFVGPRISKKRLKERLTPEKVAAPLGVDEEIKRLDLLADVYDDKFAEIEANILRQREKAIKLYGKSSKEFLAIDERLNQKRVELNNDMFSDMDKRHKEALDSQAEAAKDIADETARAFDAMNNSIGNELGDAITKAQSFSDAFKNIMSDLISQLISAGITSAFGGAVGGGNVFSGLFSSAVGATAGGNAFGGGVSPIASHRVNERGDPEMLTQAGKQFLLPNGKGGKVTPLSGGKGGGGQPNISMINMGTPMNVESVNITEDGVEVMINDKLAMFDKALTAEMGKTNSSKGRAMKNAFRLENNMRR